MNSGGDYKELQTKLGGDSLSASRDWNPLVQAVNVAGSPSSGNRPSKITTIEFTDPGADYPRGSILAVKLLAGQHPRQPVGELDAISSTTSTVLVCNDQIDLVDTASGYARFINTSEPCLVLVDEDNVPDVLAECGPLDSTTVAHENGTGLVCLSAEIVLDSVSYIWVVASPNNPIVPFVLTEDVGETTSGEASANITDFDFVALSPTLAVTVLDNGDIFTGGLDAANGYAIKKGGEYHILQLGCTA